ncbi:aldo/keto reductase [Kitasatospora sp. NPDC008050]|uniref:aldo/keto reductase n=1 Tax=Kitasatospora sp. NPDC008050 TaxID=3364021 RepID=UPI0036DFC4A1
MNTTQDGPAVVVGTMRCSGSFNGLMVLGRDTDESRDFIEGAIAQGFRTFDTAPAYARGRAEEDLGVHLPGDASVWTKVGVDITTPLPTLDYSREGLVKSLQGSLKRLGRDHVEVAFVHNPEPTRVSDIDFAAFARHCSETGQADHIGVSVLLPEVSLPQIAGRLPAGSLIMCEADQLDPQDTSTLALLADYRLVIRSLFSGGSRLHAAPAGSEAESIAARISEIHEIFAPEAVVIGPRDREQMHDYEPGPLWTSFPGQRPSPGGAHVAA